MFRHSPRKALGLHIVAPLDKALFAKRRSAVTTVTRPSVPRLLTSDKIHSSADGKNTTRKSVFPPSRSYGIALGPSNTTVIITSLLGNSSSSSRRICRDFSSHQFSRSRHRPPTFNTLKPSRIHSGALSSSVMALF